MHKLLLVLISFLTIFVFKTEVYAQTTLPKDPLQIKIIAPFQSLFKKVNYSSVSSKSIYSEKIQGTLETYNKVSGLNEVYDVEIGVRGNYTLLLCNFFKLKIKFKKEQTTQEKVFNKKNYELSTHCLDENNDPDFTKKYVLTSSPHREKFLLDIESDLGFKVPRSKNIIAEYIDNTDPANLVTLTDRPGYILETTKNFIQRNQALYPVIGLNDDSRKLADPTSDASDILPQRFFNNVAENSEINLSDVLKIHLFNALIANADAYIKKSASDARLDENGKPMPDQSYSLWNIKLFAQSKEKWLVYETDLNYSVMLVNINLDPQATNPVSPEMRAETLDFYRQYSLYVINEFNKLGTNQDRKNALLFFLSVKNKLYSKSNLLNKDNLFKYNYNFYLDEFYKLIDNELLKY